MASVEGGSLDGCGGGWALDGVGAAVVAVLRVIIVLAN